MRNDLDDLDRAVLAIMDGVVTVLAPADRGRVEIGVSEVLANIVLHGGSAAPIEIELYEDDTAVRVDIIDPLGAPAFDPSRHAAPPETVDPLAEGGRGLGLVHLSADRIDYRPMAGRMGVSLTFLKSED